MSGELVSIHGGHSGQFCTHATDSLEAVVLAYIDKGFSWVGITEHMPPAADRFIYPDERQAGLDLAAMRERFDRYMAEGRRLQAQYADRIALYIGFETEAYSGALDSARALQNAYRPDYIIGGVHHVDDNPIDYSAALYQQAITAAGGIEALYCRYFDRQLELIESLNPRVIAHFDLVRMYDANYATHMAAAPVKRRIERNLAAIARRGIILDYNVAALRKGALEPYLSHPLLETAIEMGIPIVPGDDSHGVETVGAYIAQGMARLKAAGVRGEWVRPVTPNPG